MKNSKPSKEEEKTSPYLELYGKTPGEDEAGTPDGEKAKGQARAFGSAATSPGPESKDSGSEAPFPKEDGKQED